MVSTQQNLQAKIISSRKGEAYFNYVSMTSVDHGHTAINFLISKATNTVSEIFCCSGFFQLLFTQNFRGLWLFPHPIPCPFERGWGDGKYQPFRTTFPIQKDSPPPKKPHRCSRYRLFGPNIKQINGQFSGAKNDTFQVFFLCMPECIDVAF